MMAKQRGYLARMACLPKILMMTRIWMTSSGSAGALPTVAGREEGRYGAVSAVLVILGLSKALRFGIVVSRRSYFGNHQAEMRNPQHPSRLRFTNSDIDTA